MNDPESPQQQELPLSPEPRQQQQRESQWPSLFSPLTTATATLRRALDLYLKSGTVRSFLQLAIVVVVPTTAILMTLVYAIMPRHNDDNNDDDDDADTDNNHGNGDETWQELYARYVVVLSTGSFLQKTLGTISEGAIAIAVAELYVRRTPVWFYCLHKAARKAKMLVVTGVLAWMITQLGFASLVVPGILLRIRFVSIVPVIVLEENHTPLSALRRSWELSSGHLSYVFRCLILVNLLYLLTDWILQWLLRGNSGHPLLDLTFQLVKSIPSTAIAPLRGILKTVLYINLLVLQEHTTQEQFAQQFDGRYQESSIVLEEGGVSREPLLGNENDDEIEHSFEDPSSPLFPNDMVTVETAETTYAAINATVEPKSEDSFSSAHGNQD